MNGEIFTITNSTLLSRMTSEDRDICRSVLQSKQHLGPLGMIEIAYMLGKMGGRVRTSDDEGTGNTLPTEPEQSNSPQ